MFRSLTLSTVLGAACLALLAAGPSVADAHPPGYYGAYGSYYGSGGHDTFPHWHTTYTPFGPYSWYGAGAHDYLPHGHSYGPFSYRGYSYTPWGPTVSHYPRYPYSYAPCCPRRPGPDTPSR